MTARLAGTTTALAIVCGLLSGRAASAGQSPADAVPPGTVMLGPIRLTPSLTVKDLGVDDNVFNEEVDPKQDFTFTVSPRADVLLRVRRMKLSYLATTDYVYYRTYRSERGTNTSSLGRVDFDLGFLKPYATVQGVNTKSRPNAEIDVRARHHDLTYGAGVAIRVASRTSLVVNGTRNTLAYEPDAESFRGFDLSRSFDGSRHAVDGGVSIALTPITTFAVTVAREQQRFDLSPDRDSDTWRVSPTVTFSPTGLLTGSATVGYRRFHTLSAALPDYSGLVSIVGIGATIYGRHQMQATFNRDVQYSYDLTTPYYLGTGGTLTWTTAIAGPFDVRGTAGRYLMDYKTGGALTGSDKTTVYGVGLGYRFANRARIGVNTDWSRRDSNRSAQRDYRNHRIFAGLTWGTPS